jgi:mRNA-degrading endonuclease RelE of RelBE toxin-antitoxin system
MRIEIAQPADIALRSLSQDDRQRVQAWLDHLRNWEGDRFIQTRSHRLPSFENTYVLQTSTDIRIFFTKENDTITVFDVAKRPAILTSGHISGGEGK